AGKDLRSAMSDREWNDLTHFEGNANAFRVLTHQFRGRRQGGFAMTYSTLASIVKYPYESGVSAKGKFGFFVSETDSYMRVADELGILRLSKEGEPLRFARHPLVYIVEAADDICYEVMDIEDAHKLKILSTSEVIEAFLNFFEPERQARMVKIMDTVADPNEKIAYLRSCVVGALVEQCAATFLAHEEEILAGTFEGSLLSSVRPLEREGYKHCTDISWQKIYRSQEVVDIELAGNRIITFLMEMLTEAVLKPDLNYSQLLLARFPEQYDVDSPTLYGKIQAVLDHVSAMTDVYALDLYRKLNGMSLPAV
ncbi:MAG: dNTP triphosphohydrolase, partial [Muribaculaceae bacterium]|nr:dNTP triphosphohydrolase [Muribaculaceae bacterium]